MNEHLKAIYGNILDGQQQPAVNGVQAAIDAGLEPGIILTIVWSPRWPQLDDFLRKVSISSLKC